jgi:C1A family cysteine protease
MRAAIAIRPVSVAVDAQAWSFYGGGIFSNCGTSLDHGVLAVGYNYDAEDNSKSYWIVKNSWGASWGESGYIRLAMGNTCGILNSASYPTA